MLFEAIRPVGSLASRFQFVLPTTCCSMLSKRSSLQAGRLSPVATGVRQPNASMMTFVVIPLLSYARMVSPVKLSCVSAPHAPHLWFKGMTMHFARWRYRSLWRRENVNNFSLSYSLTELNHVIIHLALSGRMTKGLCGKSMWD